MEPVPLQLNAFVPAHLGVAGPERGDLFGFDGTGWSFLKPFYDVTLFGAVGDGATDDTDALDAAFAACADDGGGTVLLPAGTYLTTGGHVLGENVTVVGAGAFSSRISHSGDNACFTIDTSGGAGDLLSRVRLRDLRLSGNAGSSAVGIEIKDSFGTELRSLVIDGYTGGVGLRLRNVVDWTEGTLLEDCSLANNATGIQFKRESGANVSFGYTRFHNFVISVPASGVGIDMGGAGVTGANLYGGVFVGNIWLSGNDATAVLVRSGFSWYRSNVFVRGENPSGFTGCVGINNSGTVKCYGFFQIDGTVTNTLGSGTRIAPSPIVDSISGAAGGFTYKTLLVDSESPSDTALLAYAVGAGGATYLIAQLYDASGSEFRVVKGGVGQEPSEATRLLSVDADGQIVMLWNNRIISGSGSPESSVTANVGSLYLRADGGAGTSLYVKESGSGNTGWVAK